MRERKIGVNFLRLFFRILVPVLTTSCATRPDKIKPEYVAPPVYSNLSCDQIRERLQAVTQRLTEAYAAQEKTANKDEWVAAGGPVLFPRPGFSRQR